MNRHRLRAAALLISVILCFVVVSPMMIRSTSAFVIGQSHICRANYYSEKQESSVPDSSVPESSVPESSVPESSIPESSDVKPPTGDGLNILPLIAMLLCSLLTVAAVCVLRRRTPKHKNTKD